LAQALTQRRDELAERQAQLADVLRRLDALEQSAKPDDVLAIALLPALAILFDDDPNNVFHHVKDQ
jgi:hypothetical protein